MHVLAIALTVLCCLGILSIGVTYLIRPSAIAPGFGFPAIDEPDPFHGVKGVRDSATGIAGLAVLTVGEPLATGVLMLAFALVPLGDMLLVLRRGGARAVALGVHGATAVLVAATGALWLALA